MTPKPQEHEEIELDEEKRCSEVVEFETSLKGKIVGQERAVRQVVNRYQTTLAGLNAPNRPIGNFLFLGPTGSGKTRMIEAMSESLFGDPYSFLKVDCGEFQHSHEISKLIGSPPGYIGHRETSPSITQETLDQFHTDKLKLTLLLFDEIEKASDTLWKILLGILDKATLTLGDNRKVDFSHCMVFMTSNLGAEEISRIISGEKIGFVHNKPTTEIADADADNKIYHAALEAAKKKFSPEFMNRVDKVVVFRALTQEHLRKILDIELEILQKRFLVSQTERIFVVKYSEEAKNFLLREGTDLKYGARHLKREIERRVAIPIANFLTTKQIELGDIIKIYFDENKLVFKKERIKKLK